MAEILFLRPAGIPAVHEAGRLGGSRDTRSASVGASREDHRLAAGHGRTADQGTAT